jgi:hypothetical protein
VLRRFSPEVFELPHRDRSTAPLDDEARSRLQMNAASLLFSHPISQPLPRVSMANGAIRFVPRQYRRHHTDTTGSFDDYLAVLSAKTRQTLRRKVRRCCVEFDDQQPVRVFRTHDELRQFHALARGIAVKSYHERLFDAGLPESPAYLDETHREGRSARGYLLMRKDVPVAYLYTPVDRGIALYTFLGFDPAFAEWSPGAVLQFFALRSMFGDEGISRLDFAEGDGQHKATFATGHTLCADIYYFRPSPGSLFLIGAHMAITGVDRSAVWTIDRLGLRSAIRHWLHR